jgi:hypothetical protein
MDRRESLAALAGAAAALAGCSGFGEAGGESSATPAADRGSTGDGPGHGSTGDPESLLVRTPTEQPPLWLSDDQNEGRPTPDERRHYHDSEVIDTVSLANNLELAETVDEGRVNEFLDGTDFQTETLYLETVQVEACFELMLCRIAWGPRKVSTDYGRRTLPWDEPCGADERVFEARLIRIPDSIAADDVNSFSSSVGGSPCGADGPRAEGSGGSDSGTALEETDGSTSDATTTTGGEQ